MGFSINLYGNTNFFRSGHIHEHFKKA